VSSLRSRPYRGVLPFRSSHPMLVAIMTYALLAQAGPDEEVISQGPGYRVQFDVKSYSGKASFVVTAHHDWAPFACARFMQLVKRGFYNDTRIFLINDRYLQLGLKGGSHAQELLERVKKEDASTGEPLEHLPGRIAFVPTKTEQKWERDEKQKGDPLYIEDGAGSTQLMIHFMDNTERLKDEGVRPFGEIEGTGMATIRKFYKPTKDDSIDIETLMREDEGFNKYLDEQVPKLTKIVSAKVLETWKSRQLLVKKKKAKDEV